MGMRWKAGRWRGGGGRGDYAAHSKSLTHSNVDLKHLFNLEDLETNYKHYLWSSNYCPPVCEKIKTTCFAPDLGGKARRQNGQALSLLFSNSKHRDTLILQPLNIVKLVKKTLAKYRLASLNIVQLVKLLQNIG